MRRLRLKSRTFAVLIFFTLLNIALGTILWTSLTTPSQSIHGAAFIPLVGHSAPDFTLTPWKSLSGQSIRLSALKGNLVVLNIWASWCDPCKQEAPTFEAAWRKYQARGVLFLGVNDRDRQQAAQQFLQTYSITYPNGPDPSEEISAAYGVNGIPTTIFIDRSGIVARTILGPIDAATLEAEIQQLL